MSDSFVTQWTVAHQLPLSMEFPWQEYWSELPFPSPGDLPNPGIEPTSLASLALAGRVFTSCSTGYNHVICKLWQFHFLFWSHYTFLFLSLVLPRAMTNLDSVLKSRDVTLPTKVHLVKAMVFPVVMYGCELDCEESWAPKNWCFWTVVLEKTLEIPLDCKESNQSIRSVLGIHWKDWC